MRRLILCADNRTPYTDEDVFYKHCIQNTQKYAESKAFDFRFELLTEMVEGRHWSWQKIKCVLKYVDDYDEILWIDSDASIYNRDVNVFEAIRTGPELILWNERNTNPLLYMLADGDFKSLCAGIFMVDCSNKDKAKQLLKEWWNDMKDTAYAQKHPWEQYVINNIWIKDTHKRTYLKGVDLSSFSLEKVNQAFLHVTSGIYKYYNQLHEAKKLTIVNRKHKVGIFISKCFTTDAFQLYLYAKLYLETNGYPVWFLIEQENNIYWSTYYRNIAIHFLTINAKYYSQPWSTIIYGTAKPSPSLETIFIKDKVNIMNIDTIKSFPNMWAPIFFDRVKSMYTSKSSVIDIMIHANDTHSLRMAVLYALQTKHISKIHILNADKSVLSGFDSSALEFHNSDFYSLVCDLEKRDVRLIVLSYQIKDIFDYVHCEAMYKGIPLIHNSSLKIGYHYSNIDGLQNAVKEIANLDSFSTLHNQYKAYLKSVDPWNQPKNLCIV